MLHRLALSAVLLAAITSPASSAIAAPSMHRCASADLRYGIQEGMPKYFGVWRLNADGTTCGTAHRVARTWQRRFEQSPTAKLPRTVRGFRFRELPPDAAQTYRLRGTNGSAVVRFDYVVPNG